MYESKIGGKYLLCVSIFHKITYIILASIFSIMQLFEALYLEMILFVELHVALFISSFQWINQDFPIFARAWMKSTLRHKLCDPVSIHDWALGSILQLICFIAFGLKYKTLLWMVTEFGSAFSRTAPATGWKLHLTEVQVVKFYGNNVGRVGPVKPSFFLYRIQITELQESSFSA